jgi:iron-sulfur cluster assembly protein
MSQDFPVIIDAAAVERIMKLIERKGGPGSFLRIGVKGGGCSGLEYMMRLDDTLRAGDLIADIGDCRVVCDPKSAEFLRGSTLVWTGNLMQGGFAFENPNAKRSCGCGVSFTPK